MICKFFKTRKGGGVSSVDYMLNERVDQGTARILKGDEFLTRELIKTMTQKHKTCAGVLSFEEKNIDENAKKEIMESFENALLTPEMKGRYNILWIEHTDKGRLELNFIIPKMDLGSKKAFNPYFHPVDSKRIDFWRDFVNLSYGFSNPKDPAKEQTIQGSKKEKQLFKDYGSLDKILHQQVADEVINSRDELITFLEQNSIEVTRKGKDYLSIKLPESKKAKRFKGSIYDEQFTSFAELREIRREKERRAKEFNRRDNEKELRRIEQELKELISLKSQFYREKIRRTNERLRKKAEQSFQRDREKSLQSRADEIQIIKPSNELSSGNAYDDDFVSDCVVSVDQALSNQQRANDNGQQWESVSLYREKSSGTTGEFLLHTTELKEEYDNIRTRVNRRNREITNEDNRISKSRNELTQYYQNGTRELQEKLAKFGEQIQGIGEQIRRTVQGIRINREEYRKQQRQRFTKFEEQVRSFGSKFAEQINGFRFLIKERINGVRGRLKQFRERILIRSGQVLKTSQKIEQEQLKAKDKESNNIKKGFGLGI
ncbi:relaxase/mobilization nuclease domain-containing protein [Campylobacter jejuni]|uniref:relaxase/mobilization nuclease domain-containing protein n=1 Tax=Campylobacter jejuni TaxID=197 RepID=UPI0011A6376D|nr:relaxase/mobilization nuclease domain-containing protein [Campylobacter jejuni]